MLIAQSPNLSPWGNYTQNDFHPSFLVVKLYEGGKVEISDLRMTADYRQLRYLGLVTLSLNYKIIQGS